MIIFQLLISGSDDNEEHPQNIEFILIIFSFIIQKSFELEPKRDYLNRELQQDLELPTYNWTEPEPEQIEEKYHESKKTKPVLKGFNLIKKNEEKKEDGQKEKSSLVVFFKNVGDKSVFKKYIYFYITIINNKVRLLENDNKNNQKLVKAVLNENSLSSDNVEYIVEETEEIKQVIEGKASAKMEQPNIIFLGQDSTNSTDIVKEIETLLNDTKTSDITIMSEEVLEDITNQDYEPNSIIYFNVQDIKKSGSQSYRITGNFTIPFEMESEKEVIIFHLPEIDTFKATLSKIGYEIYQMSFSIPDYIKTDLNYAWANITERKIIKKRRLEEKNKYYETLEFSEKEKDQLSLPKDTIKSQSYGVKITSSGGLSGGAIAGIVIACVFVLVCLVFVVIFFMKPKPKPKDISAIDFYNSSLSVIQDK